PLSWSFLYFFFSSRRRHTRFSRDWSSDVCSSDLESSSPSPSSSPASSSGPASTWGFGVGSSIGTRKAHSAVFSGCTRTSQAVSRSEERRVGKECRWRWWVYYVERINHEGAST